LLPLPAAAFEHIEYCAYRRTMMAQNQEFIFGRYLERNLTGVKRGSDL